VIFRGCFEVKVPNETHDHSMWPLALTRNYIQSDTIPSNMGLKIAENIGYAEYSAAMFHACWLDCLQLVHVRQKSFDKFGYQIAFRFQFGNEFKLWPVMPIEFICVFGQEFGTLGDIAFPLPLIHFPNCRKQFPVGLINNLMPGH